MKRLMSNRRGVRPAVSYVQLQSLEDRTVPNTYTVSTGGDSPLIKGTLRQAIAAANSNAGADTIVFSGKGAVGTITLTQGELLITDSVTITGPGNLTISGGNDSRVFNINGAATLTVSMSDLTITNGNATGRGGGIWNQGENLTLINCTISNNTASTAGGGISSVDGLVNLFSCTITGNNTTSGNGGGVDGNTDMFLHIYDSTIADNNATGSGGGIGLGSSSLYISRSTIANNQASAGGGGLYLVGALGTGGALIRHSTFSGNFSFQSGGAIALSSIFSTLEMNNCTLTANDAGYNGGGIIHSGNGALAIESTIIAGNNAGFGYDDVWNNSLSATLKSSAIGSTNGFTYSSLGGNIATGVDLKLGPLASNGGLTQTHALLAGSPCIDAGSNPDVFTIDQRSTGYPRVLSGKIDIGAVEHLPSVVTTTADKGMGSLRQVVLDANAVLNASTITFDPVLFATPQTIALTTGPITVSDHVTIQGPGAHLATISGSDASRVFEIINGSGTIVVAINGLTVANGSVAGIGGGIVSQAENLTLSDCVITNNRTTNASSGGGVSSPGGGTLTLIRCIVSDNQAGTNGGGVDANGGAIVTLIDCTIANNKATGSGGGVGVGSSSLLVQGSTLTGNSASTGGALYFAGAVGPSGLTIRNSTMSGNTATSGGAINLSNVTGTLMVQNSTITANAATNNGGGIHRNGGTATITTESAILQGNSATTGPDVYTTGVVAAKTTAFGTMNGITTYTNNGGNLIGQDIKLGPLADNGGPTKTHSLLEGSPCIDVGSNPIPSVSDQRGIGFPRLINGAPDMGAIERGGFVVTTINDAGLGSLRQTIVDANAYPGADTITFDSTIFATPQVITLLTGELKVTDHLTITGPDASLVTVSGNKANRVFQVSSNATVLLVTLSGLTIADGKTTGGEYGAGILNVGENLTLTNCVVTNNIADGAGGGIANPGGATLLVDRCSIINNQSLTFNGGGLDGNSGTSITVRDSTVAGNSAKASGGGISCGSDNMLIERSTISGNTASTGAGINPNMYSTAGLIVIRDSTISGNSATNGAGGGVYPSGVGTLLVQNSTITANSSTTMGGGISFNGKIALESSIVQGNIAPNGTDVFTPTTVTAKTSAIGNLDGITTFKNDGGNLIGTDIKLGPLANNGGPTQTHALLPGSPCINVGSNPASLVSDQRGLGFPRTIGGLADIGAIEFGGFIVTNVGDKGPGSLRQTVIDANNHPGANTITFDPVVFASSQIITLTSGQILVTDSLTIQGPGAALATVSGNNASRVFEINGSGVLDVTLSGLTIANGKLTGTALGAGIFSDDEHLTLRYCVVANNVAEYAGGGVAINGNKTASLLVDHSTIIGNQSTTSNGGGIYGNGSVITIRDSTVADNYAGSLGGAMSCRSDQLLIERSTISGNMSAGYVGGVMLFSYYSPTALLTIRNTTISSNSATTGWGGVYASMPILVQNSTVTANNGVGFGGGLTSSLITLESSIVQGNLATTGPDIYTTGTVMAKTTALGSINGIATYVNNGGNLIGQDIKLGPLADNGGPTKTHALLPGSAAIDKGSNPMALTTDQRGALRAVGSPDIGAYEVQPPPRVSSVVINDGSAQRSLVTSLTIHFDQVVTLPANPVEAFHLARQITADTVTLSASVTHLATTSVTLTFVGGFVNGASLADGRYTLTIDATKVGIVTGQLDGNGDGNGGDNYILAGDPTVAPKLYRLFGDANGDGSTNSVDFAAFRSVFGLGASIFDFNNDNLTNSADFAAFRARFGLNI